MSTNVEKTQADRIREGLVVLRKITDDIGIDPNNPSIRVFKKRMSVYWRDGKTQEDRLPLYGYDRVIIYKFPRWSHQEMEVTLRVSKIKNPILPPDLMAILLEPSPSPQSVASPCPLMQNPQSLSDPAATAADQTNSEKQSDPSHPSLPVSEEK